MKFNNESTSDKQTSEWMKEIMIWECRNELANNLFAFKFESVKLCSQKSQSSWYYICLFSHDWSRSLDPIL